MLCLECSKVHGGPNNRSISTSENARHKNSIHRSQYPSLLRAAQLSRCKAQPSNVGCGSQVFLRFHHVQASAVVRMRRDFLTPPMLLIESVPHGAVRRCHNVVDDMLRPISSAAIWLTWKNPTICVDGAFRST